MFEMLIVADRPFPRFIFAPFFFILAHFQQVFVCLFQIWIFFCQFFHLLFVRPPEEFHPCYNPVRILITFRYLGQFQNLNLHLIAVQLHGLVIPKIDHVVTDVIIMEICEIQDSDLDALLKFLIPFSFFQLIGKHLAQIKHLPLVPVIHIGNLHLHVDLNSVPQKDVYIQNALFFLFGPPGKLIFQQNRLADFFWWDFQQHCNKSLSRLWIAHQLFETPVHIGFHDKFFLAVCDFLIGFICSHRQSPF